MNTDRVKKLSTKIRISAPSVCSHFPERTATVAAMIVTQMNANWKA